MDADQGHGAPSGGRGSGAAVGPLPARADFSPGPPGSAGDAPPGRSARPRGPATRAGDGPTGVGSGNGADTTGGSGGPEALGAAAGAAAGAAESWTGCRSRGVNSTGSATRWRDSQAEVQLSSSSGTASRRSGSRVSRQSIPVSAIARPMSWPGHSCGPLPKDRWERLPCSGVARSGRTIGSTFPAARPSSSMSPA
ncbi:hypothetical protein VR45_39435, partial [Streptomyces sp. NRRL S-495]